MPQDLELNEPSGSESVLMPEQSAATPPRRSA